MTEASSDYFSRSSCDVVCLLAAGQVAAIHWVDYMQAETLQLLVQLLRKCRGEPAPFFISRCPGTAWKQDATMRLIYLSRFYRIVAGLSVCVVVSTAIIVAYAARSSPSPKRDLS
jgi:hypothetical protein